MTAIRFDPEIDLEVCEMMCQEFEDYLASDVLYWQMNPLHPHTLAWPKLTIGGGLERLCRLQAYGDALSAEQSARLEHVRRQLEILRDAHAIRYAAKAARELQSRLDAWEWFLDDYAKRPGELAAYYPSEVRDRLKIDLLVDTLRDVAGVDEQDSARKSQRLRKLDERLRADFISGDFVWDTELAAAFPPERYWWLYGTLKESG